MDKNFIKYLQFTALKFLGLRMRTSLPKRLEMKLVLLELVSCFGVGVSEQDQIDKLISMFTLFGSFASGELYF